MTAPTRRLPWFRISLATAVLFWGIVSLACGSSNEATKPDETPENSRYEPEVSNRDGGAPTTGGEAGPAATAGELPEPTGTAAAAPSAEPAVPVVRFAVDEASLLMGLPMEPYKQPVGAGVTTSAVQSGDWFVENFVYRGSQLDVLAEGVPESVIVTMSHRKADASMLIWSRPLSAFETERYTDVLAEDMIATVATTPILLDLAWADAVPEGTLSSTLRGLAMSTAKFADRDALQVDLMREHPTSRINERIRLRIVRQGTPSGTVLVLAAIRTRSADFRSLYTELDRVLLGVTLQGQALGLGVNPERDLSKIGDEYGLELAPVPADPGMAERASGWLRRAATTAVLGATRAGLDEAAKPAPTPAPSDASDEPNPASGDDGEAPEPPKRERPDRGL